MVRRCSCRPAARSRVAVARRCWSSAGSDRSGVTRGSFVILNACAASIVEGHDFFVARLGIRRHRPELDDVERVGRGGRRGPGGRGPAAPRVTDHDRRNGQEQRGQDDKAEEGERRRRAPLCRRARGPGQGRRRATGPGSRRNPRCAPRQGQAGLVRRDPDDPALVLAQPGDRLDERQLRSAGGRWRPRRRLGMEDVLDIVDTSKNGPRIPPVPPVARSVALAEVVTPASRESAGAARWPMTCRPISRAGLDPIREGRPRDPVPRSG